MNILMKIFRLTYRRLFYLILILLSVIGCAEDISPVNNSPVENTLTTDVDDRLFLIDATSRDQWVYLDLDQGEIIKPVDCVCDEGQNNWQKNVLFNDSMNNVHTGSPTKQ